MTINIDINNPREFLNFRFNTAGNSEIYRRESIKIDQILGIHPDIERLLRCDYFEKPTLANHENDFFTMLRMVSLPVILTKCAKNSIKGKSSYFVVGGIHTWMHVRATNHDRNSTLEAITIENYGDYLAVQAGLFYLLVSPFHLPMNIKSYFWQWIHIKNIEPDLLKLTLPSLANQKLLAGVLSVSPSQLSNWSKEFDEKQRY